MEENQQRVQVALQQYVPQTVGKPRCLWQHGYPPSSAFFVSRTSCTSYIFISCTAKLGKEQLSRRDSSTVAELLESLQSLLPGFGREVGKWHLDVTLSTWTCSIRCCQECGKKMDTS